MSGSMITLVVVGFVIVIGLAVFFSLIDKIIKGDIKIKFLSKAKDTKPKEKEVIQVPAAAEKKPEPQKTDEEEDDDPKEENPVTETPCARRIHEYYKKRWGEPDFTILSPEDAENPEDGEIVSAEDAAKLMTLRNLFDKK